MQTATVSTGACACTCQVGRATSIALKLINYRHTEQRRCSRQTPAGRALRVAKFICSSGSALAKQQISARPYPCK